MELYQENKLRWIRNQLKLSPNKIMEDLSLKKASFYYYENHYQVKPKIAKIMSSYYNYHWQLKFSNAFPEFNGEEIKDIDLNFLYAGDDV